MDIILNESWSPGKKPAKVVNIQYPPLKKKKKKKKKTVVVVLALVNEVHIFQIYLLQVSTSH